MRTFSMTMSGVIAALLLAAWQPAMAQPPLSRQDFSVLDLMDQPVAARDGIRIGKVSDVIVDPAGRVTYIVISRDRDLSETLTPIPASSFEERLGGRGLVLDMDRSRIAEAPHFARQDWPPDFNGRRWENWDRDARGYYAINGTTSDIYLQPYSRYTHGTAGGVGPGGSDSGSPGTGSVHGSGFRGQRQ